MSEIDDEEEEKEICSYVMHLECAFNKLPCTFRVNGWNEKDMFRLPTNEVVEELNRAFVMIEIIFFNTQLTHNNPLESTTSRGWDKRHQRQLYLTYDRPVATILVNFTWSPAEGKCIPRAGCITVASAIYTSTQNPRSWMYHCRQCGLYILPSKIPGDGCIIVANAIYASIGRQV